MSEPVNDVEWGDSVAMKEVKAFSEGLSEGELMWKISNELIENKKKKWYEVMANPKSSVQEITDAYYEWNESVSNRLLFLERPYLEQRLTPQIMRRAIHEVLSKQLVFIRSLKESVYEEYEQDRRSGVPLPHRREKLDAKKESLVRWNKMEMDIVETLKNIQPRPIKEWAVLGDVEKMKKLGLRGFISVCPSIFYVTEEK